MLTSRNEFTSYSDLWCFGSTDSCTKAGNASGTSNNTRDNGCAEACSPDGRAGAQTRRGNNS